MSQQLPDDRGTRRCTVGSDAGSQSPGPRVTTCRATPGEHSLSTAAGRILIGIAGIAAALLTAACGTTGVTLGPTSLASASLAPTAIAPSSSAAISGPSASTTAGGFPFTADAITGYYETQGYTCTAAAPRTKAPGYALRTCQQVDESGRTRVIAVVTDAAGGLADGWASVSGAASESVLAPSDALGPLAGFLGAMLGQDAGASLLPWLAAHLGDLQAETTSGTTRIAVYRATATDHATIYVEAAGRAYSAAPGAPSP